MPYGNMLNLLEFEGVSGRHRSRRASPRSRACLAVLAAIAALLPLVATALAADVPPVTHHTEWARMRDGTLLATEVYLPRDASGPLPVVMLRSPYNGGDATGCMNRCEELAARGYAVVNQDVRGTGRAHGVMTPFLQEQHDGYDAVEWAASRPWSNGRVGLWGVSYYGVTVMQAAIAHPPHLVAAVAVITASDYHDNWTYVNGVLDLWFTQSWLAGWADVDANRRQQLRAGVPWPEVRQRALSRGSQNSGQLPDWNRQLPLDQLPAFKDTVPFYYDWLAQPDYQPFWSSVDIERRYASIRVPMLLVGGWYDIFSVGTVRNFIGISTAGGSALARAQTRLVMYPLCHGNCNAAMSFAPDFWSDAAPPMSLAWWDHWLKGADNEVTHDPPVRLFVMVPPEQGNRDEGFWITADHYPLPGTMRTRFALHSAGHANSRTGDGTLAAGSAASGPADTFTYDPLNPVPTLGGALCCNDQQFAPGAFDQSELELRDDILVYTSAPLAQDLTVVGPVTVDFWATSSARDTDFTAKLVDVRPDGVAHNILDRIINAGLRGGSKSTRSPITPGRAYEYRLALGDTALIFKAGHRIRLEISSSNFPHFARNPNTGEAAARAGRFISATQTLRHDARHPSWLELPVVSLQRSKESAGAARP
jgi:putative CocE/NonD family hydrolase